MPSSCSEGCVSIGESRAYVETVQESRALIFGWWNEHSQRLESQRDIIILWREPGEDDLGRGLDIPHHRHLCVYLRDVALVDAQCIHPEPKLGAGIPTGENVPPSGASHASVPRREYL